MSRTAVCSEPGCPNLKPCPEHGRDPNAHWSRDRDSAAQGRLRVFVMHRSGGACERCHRQRARQVHHVRPGNEPEHAIAVCDDCHVALDNKARRTR